MTIVFKTSDFEAMETDLLASTKLTIDKYDAINKGEWIDAEDAAEDILIEKEKKAKAVKGMCLCVYVYACVC
jgi:hypothetical protein